MIHRWNKLLSKSMNKTRFFASQELLFGQLNLSLLVLKSINLGYYRINNSIVRLTLPIFFFFFFVWLQLQHAEITGPGTEPTSQQWQCQILKHQATRELLPYCKLNWEVAEKCERVPQNSFWRYTKEKKKKFNSTPAYISYYSQVLLSNCQNLWCTWAHACYMARGRFKVS